jgi:26S proteasome regulatory subunit N9
MKALSLGLIKGSIDQVLEEATLTWVQPRVLSLDQANMLQSRVAEWSKDVKGIVNLMQSEIPEVAIHL